jgi:predicted N-acyltransferase
VSADGGGSIGARIVERIAEIPAADWDACAGSDNPFLCHAFLAALEDSKCVSARAGWQPYHAAFEDSDGKIIGVAPMYVKSHSMGEYVFDRGWAEAYGRAGGSYYPKLQVAVPFTPVPGRRVLLRPEHDRPAVMRAAIGALAEIAHRAGVSSLHVTFPTGEQAEAFRAAGWLIRQGLQYHWENAGFASFDAFLAALSHSKRKAIRKERREVAEQGLILERLTGAALRPEHWERFYDFYIATSEHKWGRPYLNQDFFHQLGATMADRVLLVMAKKDGGYVGGALNLIGRDTLYGRNWGCRGDFKHLHFETCYYQAIEFARVEAGAQGEHKLQRGYLPQPTWSAHWIADKNFRVAVAKYLERETAAVEGEREMLQEHSPFRDGQSTGVRLDVHHRS